MKWFESLAPRTNIIEKYHDRKLRHLMGPNPDKRDKCVNEIIFCRKNAETNSNLLIESNKGNLPDDEDAYFTDVAKRSPFRLGHIVEVIGIESEEDDLRGVIVHMKEVKKKGYVPLCDLEVTSKEGRNFWSVREYVVWFANR